MLRKQAKVEFSERFQLQLAVFSLKKKKKRTLIFSDISIW